MKKTGIMGGSFNPIHVGHLEIAECAWKEYGLDEILFIPNYCPPHKDSSKISDSGTSQLYGYRQRNSKRRVKLYLSDHK